MFNVSLSRRPSFLYMRNRRIDNVSVLITHIDLKESCFSLFLNFLTTKIVFGNEVSAALEQSLDEYWLWTPVSILFEDCLYQERRSEES